MKTICATGHRPNRIFGYDLTDEGWVNLKNQMKRILVEEQATDAMSGMALGTDTIFALAVLELKDDGYPINLHCAIPCKNFDAKWAPESKKMFEDILSKADEVIYVSDKEYDEFCLSARNYYMIDHSDGCIAVWDGKAYGGTYETIMYAKYKKLPMAMINVMELS